MARALLKRRYRIFSTPGAEPLADRSDRIHTMTRSLHGAALFVLFGLSAVALRRRGVAPSIRAARARRITPLAAIMCALPTRAHGSSCEPGKR